MRYFFALVFCVLPLTGWAQDWEDRQVFGNGAAPALRIISSTDTSFFAPVIESYLAQRTGQSVEYLVTSTAQLDRIFRADPGAFDLVISSAMDLQFKLANDGFARTLDGVTHPDWAQWRQSLFAFTTEPATIVINREAFANRRLPETRQDLIEALRADPERFAGRLGTYDVRQSGLGFLFATQDARTSETYWRLMEVMGAMGTKLFCCSGGMIDDVASGEIAVAYNVLGSYASARRDITDKIKVILPADFQTTMMRTAFVSRDTKQPVAATSFVQHLIALQASTTANDDIALPHLDHANATEGQVTIALEPALMTYLDALKKQTFLKEWVNAVIQ
ncbi:extracellular solute-binding protein [Pseudosulfitobacter sp. SM2401]|uniref:ABC transporter substrate-binding protein n=1 Tax=Pseudosulfitobacter sp. SM2401 TaxID=3350098 RepID=UPI0036F32811